MSLLLEQTLQRMSMMRRGGVQMALRAGVHSNTPTFHRVAVAGIHTTSTAMSRSSTTSRIESQAQQRRRTRSLLGGGGGLIAVAGSGWYVFSGPAGGVGTETATPANTRQFTIHSPSQSEQPPQGTNPVHGSSTLLRPASPAAPRRQTVTLVFLTSQSQSKGILKSLASNIGISAGEEQTEREKWFSWIGYFREAGYDCLQMNLALPQSASSESQTDTSTTSLLADELHQQIRLSNLQRQPVLFVHHSANSDSDAQSTSQIVSQYIDPNASSASSSGGGFWSKLFGGGGGMFGSKPAISGLIVISDADHASTVSKFGKHPKLNTLIVCSNEEKGTAGQDQPSKVNGHGKISVLAVNEKNQERLIKDIERWLIREGYEG